MLPKITLPLKENIVSLAEMFLSQFMRTDKNVKSHATMSTNKNKLRATATNIVTHS